MTALVAVQFSLGGLPAGIPDGIAILNIEVFAVDIPGNAVVAITGHTQKLSILIKGVAAAGVGNQTKELVATQIVDPGQGSFWGGDHIFLMGIIEKTKFHFEPPHCY